MKFMKRYLAISAAVLALLVSIGGSTASETDEMCAQIAAELKAGGSNVCVAIKDGVATLSGVVESETDKQHAEQVASNAEGVTEVINLISVSD